MQTSLPSALAPQRRFCILHSAFCILDCFNLLCYEVVHIVCILLESHRALVAIALRTNRYGTLGSLLLAYDKEVRDTLQLVVTNLTANLLVAVIDLRTNIVLIKVCNNLLGILVVLLRDREDNWLPSCKRTTESSSAEIFPER